jgi:prepilin-type N-terminal cleavage/methylation domain-containing protein
MTQRNQGFTLTEVIVGLVIGGVILLTICVISGTAFSSSENLRREAEVYNDVFFGFNLMNYACRNATTIAVDRVNMTLTFGNSTFRTRNNRDFIYSDAGGDHAIISEVNNLNFSFQCLDAGGNWSNNNCSNASRIFRIILSGDKNAVVFNFSNDIARRN